MLPQNEGASADDVLLQERRGTVLWLTLNRPKARNGLSHELLVRLDDALAQAETDEGCRAIVIAAEGPAFCAGHDLKEMRARRNDADGGAAFYAELFALCGRVMARIVNHPKPVIARVHGMATAAGCQLVASCDLAVASEDARFATPGVDIGLFCLTPAVALSRAVPRKAALEMLFTGDPIDAAHALRIGLVNRVVAVDTLDATVTALTDKIAGKPPGVIALGKRAFVAQYGLPLERAYAETAAVMTANMLRGEAREGIDAFLEKRPPQWPANEE
jgi:enoyl-CoA hydratase/carnithine racemase